MTRYRTAVAALLVTALATSSPALAVPAVSPQVINGFGNSNAAAVALAFENEYTCTGSLWRPRIVITAAHCVHTEDGARYTPRSIGVWPPGASTRGLSAPVMVTDIVMHKDWEPDFDDPRQIARDVALLVLNRPLAQPYYDRLATPDEVAALSWNEAKVDFAGYGQTEPASDPDAGAATEPSSLQSTLLWGYFGGNRVPYDVAINGDSGSCKGDSGGPWMSVVGGERVLIGPLSGTLGAPCEAPESADETFETGPVAAANTKLLKRALKLAGEEPDQVPTTCIKGPELDRTCWDGRAWVYSYCWDQPRAELWWATGAGNWTRLETINGPRDRNLCEDPDTPYLIEFRRIVPAGKTRQAYSVRIPKQAGNPREVRDDFTATVSSV